MPAAQLKYKNTHVNVILLLNTNIYLNTCMTQLNNGVSKTNDAMNEHINLEPDTQFPGIYRFNEVYFSYHPLTLAGMFNRVS